VNYHGERRSNETHQSTTDPEARLARKGSGMAAKLSYAGHLLMEHRSALIADMELTAATGYAERDTAPTLLRRLPQRARRRTVAGDKGYDTRDFIAGCRELGVTPHVSQNTTNRRSAIDARTTRHPGHVVSLRIRKRIEEPFGWMKTVAGGRKLRYVGLQRNRAWFLMTRSGVQPHPYHRPGRPGRLTQGPMGLAPEHGGLEGAGDPDLRNGFPDFGYPSAPSGPKINTLLAGFRKRRPEGCGFITFPGGKTDEAQVRRDQPSATGLSNNRISSLSGG
jgi:hypothetical protein